jgi:hypothetical protein
MVIARIEEELRKWPHIVCKATPDCLEIPAQSPSGFGVWVHERAGGCTVGFEGWHEEFTDGAAASNCFFLGLTTACKLRVHRRGGKNYRWQLLHRVGHEWEAESETCLLFFPFWKTREVRELQNDILPER